MSRLVKRGGVFTSRVQPNLPSSRIGERYGNMIADVNHHFPPSIDAGNKTWGRNMSDDTQNPNTEPGCDDVLPPLHVSRSYVDMHEPLALPGHCVVGDGQSDVASTKPNTDPPPIGGMDRVRYERISGICEQLRADPWKLERIELMLGILATDPALRERLGAIAVKLASSPGLIENAEQLIAMGS